MATFKEQRRQNKDPLPFAIYKGINGKFGALRLNLKKAYADHYKEQGCVFLEMAPPKGGGGYDWENNKINMKLDLIDIGKIIHVFKSPKLAKEGLSIYHDKGAGTASKGKETKTLFVNRAEGMDNFFFTMKEVSFGITKEAKVPVSMAEAIVLIELLTVAIPLITSWNNNNATNTTPQYNSQDYSSEYED